MSNQEWPDVVLEDLLDANEVFDPRSCLKLGPGQLFLADGTHLGTTESAEMYIVPPCPWLFQSPSCDEIRTRHAEDIESD